MGIPGSTAAAIVEESLQEGSGANSRVMPSSSISIPIDYCSVTPQRQQTTKELRPLLRSRSNYTYFTPEREGNRSMKLFNALSRNRAQTVSGCPAHHSSEEDFCFFEDLEAQHGKERRSVTFSPKVAAVEFVPETNDIVLSRRGSWGAAPFHDEYWDGDRRTFRDRVLTPEELEKENSRLYRILKSLGNITGIYKIHSLLSLIMSNCTAIDDEEEVPLKSDKRSKIKVEDDDCLTRLFSMNFSWFFEKKVPLDVKRNFSAGIRA